MRNRCIPFGYTWNEGGIVMEPKEASVVAAVFEKYRQGDSLGVIAQWLSANKTTYLPGKCSWNKSRVKRILEDTRYLGRDGYPALIEERLFETVQKRKADGYTRRDITTAETEFLKPYMVCADCGESLHRWFIRKCSANPVEWHCNACRHHMKIGDEELLNELTAMLNRLIAKPELTDFPEAGESFALSLEARRLTNDIYRQLDAGRFDRDELKRQILRCAAEKYKGIHPLQYKTEQVKAELLRAAPLPQFSREIFGRIVRRVLVRQNKQILLELQNGRIVGEGEHSLGNNCRQNCDGHSADD